MDRIRSFKYRCSSATIAIIMYLSYSFGRTLGPFGEISSLIFGIIAGVGLAELASTKLLSFRKFRRYILKPYFIEGYWRLHTEETKFDIEHEDNESINLTKNGIMLIEYNHSFDKYSVIVSRIGASGEIFVTSSEYCYMTEGNLSVKYLNYFIIREANSPSMCVCDGLFVKRHDGSETVDFFSSTVTVEGAVPRRQFAFPIEAAEIEACRTAGETDWQMKFLRDWDRKSKRKRSRSSGQ